MNHCRDCNSDYATPGTCNCFAPGGKRHITPTPTLAPTYPYPVWVPYVQPTYPWSTTITAPRDYRITVWNNMGGTSATLTGGGSCLPSS